MERTQISLTREQMAALRARARQQPASIAALLRQAVDLLLAEPLTELRDEARAVVGRYSSGQRGTSEQHDAALAEAFGS